MAFAPLTGMSVSL